MTSKEVSFSIKRDEIKNIINNVITSYGLVNADLNDEVSFLEIMKMVMVTYSAYSVKPAFREKLMEYVKQLREVVEENLMERITETCDILNDEEYNAIVKTLDFLDSVPQPAQRTPEWYAFRADKVTASDFSVAHDKNPYSSQLDFILKKSGMETPFLSNSAIQHGVKYEDVAIYMYELRNDVSVKEYGCIPHQKYSFVGASPDGICDDSGPEEYIGRMLEIKCPPKRKFTKTVPGHYKYQILGQLECCDLEECDFFQVKISEYKSSTDYFNDSNDSIGNTNNNYPKGCIITYKDNDHLKYLYPGLFKSNDELNEFIETKKIWLQGNNLHFEKVNWWKIERYECTLVGRDRQWWLDTQPKIIDFWEDVEKYRKEGNQSLIQKRDDRKTKRKISTALKLSWQARKGASQRTSLTRESACALRGPTWTFSSLTTLAPPSLRCTPSSMACSSTAGFHHGSIRKTCCAAVKLRPTPPARSDSSSTFTFDLSLKPFVVWSREDSVMRVCIQHTSMSRHRVS